MFISHFLIPYSERDACVHLFAYVKMQGIYMYLNTGINIGESFLWG